jgi:MFS family permease
VAAALALLAIVGTANSVEDVAGFTLLQRAVRDETLSSVLGLFWGAAMGSVALGSLAAASLLHALGARSTFVLVGAVLPLLAIASFRRLRTLDRFAAPTRELDLVGAVPMFAPLSLAAKERLATKLLPVFASAGDCVIRAGAAGDRFYLVDSGELTVSVDHGERSARAGDYFGEIALLRDTPRTATVTAVSDAKLFGLERADFLAAVTGHAVAAGVADRVVGERLAATEP